MKKLIFVSLLSVLILFLIFLFVRSSSAPIQEGSVTQEEYVPNELLIRFKENINKDFIQDAINSVHGKIITYLGEEISVFQWDTDISSLRSFRLDPDLFHIRVPETVGVEKAIDVLNKNQSVIYAKKNLIIHGETIPYDPYFNKLWGLHNTGQAGGKVDADIDASEAWDIFTGSSDIVVAVIDTGVDYNHEDLASNIWINWYEYYGIPGEDDEPNGGNGYVDDIRGWDFVNNDNDPIDDHIYYRPEPGAGCVYKEIYHGTHVAGTIGAVGNNGKGVTGVNWNVKIMIVKFLDECGEGSLANAIKAIDYATENDAHLSNNSWGCYFYDQDLYDSIKRAKDDGKLFIAAAGNDDRDTDTTPHYPSCFNLDNIISVAATDNNDNKSPLSNYGAISVDLGAPGGFWLVPGEMFDENDIYSTKADNQYHYLCGTSMATPHVAGVAALVWGYSPSLTWFQVKDRIMKAVDPLMGQLCYRTVTGGRLNAYNALIGNGPPAAPSDLRAEGYCWEVKLTWQDNSNNEDGFYIYRKTGNEYVQFDYVGPNVTTYWDVELWCGQLWCYKVSAFNQYGESCHTLSKCTKTLPCYQCEGGLSLKLSADKKDIDYGELVTYAYELKNRGEFDLFDIELMDERFGEVAAKFTLKKGETKIFYKTVTLNETTTNFAEAAASYSQRNEIKNIKANACATVRVRN